RGDPASDRRGGKSRRAQFGDVVLQLLGRDSSDGPVEPRGQRRKVATVCVDGSGRPPGGEQREETLDLWILRGSYHRGPFRGRARIASRRVGARPRSGPVEGVREPGG